MDDEAFPKPRLGIVDDEFLRIIREAFIVHKWNAFDFERHVVHCDGLIQSQTVLWAPSPGGHVDAESGGIGIFFL